MTYQGTHILPIAIMVYLLTKHVAIWGHVELSELKLSQTNKHMCISVPNGFFHSGKIIHLKSAGNIESLSSKHYYLPFFNDINNLASNTFIQTY